MKESMDNQRLPEKHGSKKVKVQKPFQDPGELDPLFHTPRKPDFKRACPQCFTMIYGGGKCPNCDFEN